MPTFLILTLSAIVSLQDPPPQEILQRIDALLYDPVKAGMKRVSFEAAITVSGGRGGDALRGSCRYVSSGSGKGRLEFSDPEVGRAARHAGFTLAVLEREFRGRDWSTSFDAVRVSRRDQKSRPTQIEFPGTAPGQPRRLTLAENGLPTRADLRPTDQWRGYVTAEYTPVGDLFVRSRETLWIEVVGMGEIRVEVSRTHRKGEKYTVPGRLRITRYWGARRDAQLTLEISEFRFDDEVTTAGRR